MTTNINYSVNVSLYTTLNTNQNEKGKDGKPLAPNVVTTFMNRVSISIKAPAPLTAAQLKAEIKNKIDIETGSTEVIKLKGKEMKDADLISDVTVEYIVTVNKSGVESTTTTTVAPMTTTTTEAPTTTTTTEAPTTTVAP